MALTMKERYARLDTGKLPDEYKKRFDTIKEKTDNFEDQDVLDIWVKPFDTLYGIVESKFPDAIKKGGVIKKVKPARVKKIKPKVDKDFHPTTEKEFALPGKIEKEITAGMRKKLSKEDIIFIEDQLTNNGASTEEEMIAHFVAETAMSRAQAEKWVALRDRYVRRSVEKSIDYPTRTGLKKEARKARDIVETRDKVKVDRKSKKTVGKTFYDENGKAWKCKRYEPKLDECIMEDSEGKEITACLKDMYTTNPVAKREKGNLVDDCKDTLKEAGYTVREHKAGKKRLRRKEPRPEKVIIKERVADTFTPITKDLTSTDEKKKENKAVIDALDRVQGLFTKLFNRLSNLADDGKAAAIEKIEKLLKELLDE